METSAAVKDVLKSPCKKEKSFVFERPPEAPVFYPTEEEFENPLKYINEIAKEGLSFGILKIIPPKGWKPPFALNYDTFKFKPRIQKINELEATTRIKLHFLSKVLKAVARDGKVPKVPYVEKTLLDLHELYYIIRREGGLDAVNKRKKWNDIATEMGFCGKTSSQTLRQHYETYVIPYLEELKGELVNNDVTETDEELIKLTNIRELKSLEFLGPGPKMPTCNYNFSSSMKTRTRHKKVQYEFDPLAKYMCQLCGRDDSEGTLANCRTCYDKYHLVCLSPPLADLPKDWLCPKCMVACDPNNPFENFGFETAEKEYSLRQFGHMADKFKHNHFKVSGRLVPLDKCEEEYWRLMGSMNSSVTVEYGADLSTMDVGSGFPTQKNNDIDGISIPVAKKYTESKWNLNNLSVLRESALRHIVSNISGMKVPWVYVGMCFSTFCWHNEDHWSYSINYLHWGEPKTWYGVSGLEADKFEREIKSLVPELFENNSNILHELVTNMNPNLLMKRGVPIFRTDQKEGEFVVTFPRAYHAGFNQGFNFAEACNFAPADWIHMGRRSVIYYGHFKRNCVFSHDELICKIAENPSDIDKDICVAAFNDMREMVFTEMNRRSYVKNISGIKKSERFDFSFIKDEERQCIYCKTTCYLSGIYCPCSSNSLICLDHINNHCSCDPSEKVLRYQYTFSELVELLLKLIDVLDDLDMSINLILAMYEYREAKPGTLCKIFKQASKDNSSLCNEYLKDFKKHVALTLRCCILSKFLVQTLVVRKDTKENLSFNSLNFFFKCLKSLPWNIPELKSFENLVNNIDKFQNYLSVLLDNDKLSKNHLKACLNVINLLNVSFHEVPLLEQKLQELESYESDIINENESAFTSGFEVDFDKEQGGVDNVKGINDLLKRVSEWNSKVKLIFDYNEKVEYQYLTELISEGKQLKIDSTYMTKLCSLSEEVKQWLEKSDNLLNGDESMYLHEIVEFIANGKALPVVLECIHDIELECNKVKSWLDNLRLRYCMEDSTESLLQVLWPRKFKPRHTYFGLRLTEEPTLDSFTFPADFGEETLILAFEEEFRSLMALRWENAQKKSLPYKNEKIKCYCNGDVDEIYVCCELCQTIYHSSCFPLASQYSQRFVLLPYKNLYCSYCIRTKRPLLSILNEYLKKAYDIKLKLPEYYILKNNVNMWVSLQSKIDFFLNLRDVTCAYQKVISHEPKDLYDVPLVQLQDKSILDLKYLLQQLDVIEVSIPNAVNLWDLFEATKSDLANRRKVAKVFSPDCEKSSEVITTDLANENSKKPTEKKSITRKRKSSVQQNKPLEAGSKRVKTMKPRKKAEGLSEELPPSLLERFTVDQLRAYLNEEMCAALTCVKPSEDEVHWVQCDGKCKLWFHMKCVNVGLDEVKDDDDYICLKCLFIDDKTNGDSNEGHKSPSGL